MAETGEADVNESKTTWTARLQQLSPRLPTRAKVVGGAAQGLMSAAAAILAYLPTKPLGLQEGFWGSITAIAVVQSELSATTTSARDQFAGAAIGGIVSSALVTWVGQSLVVYALALVVSMTICWMFNIGSAARLAGSTATIIALVPHHGTPEWMMVSRIAEVAWGVAVGVAVVWLVNRIEKWRGGGSQPAPPTQK